MIRHAQEGYEGSPARSMGHEAVKFQLYYGWKECQSLGIEYVLEPLHHCNLYVRSATIKDNQSNELSWGYHIDQGLTAPFEEAKKYVYPVGMSSDEKRKLRAAARKAAKLKEQ